jgi:transposase
LDVHRDFCEQCIWQDGVARRAPRISTRPEELDEFAAQLELSDRVALEATGNAVAIARIIEPHVAEVVIVNTRKLAAISESKQKTDRHDAKTLAQMLAAGMLSGSWIPTSSRGRCGGVASPVAPGWSPTAPGPRTRSSRYCTATSHADRR